MDCFIVIPAWYKLPDYAVMARTRLSCCLHPLSPSPDAATAFGLRCDRLHRSCSFTKHDMRCTWPLYNAVSDCRKGFKEAISVESEKRLHEADA